jgi:acetyl-CoA carboxylase biotin carboxyl carrier protein
MDFNDVKRLVRLVESSNIEELAIEEEGFQIRVTKSRPGISTSVQQPIQTVQVPAVAAAPPVQIAAAPPKAAGSVPDHLAEVKSPMVGTFYRSSAPDSPPFVKEGDSVQPGQVLCIIEAMKLMNEIEAEIPGRIVKILAQNAHPVEFGQPLFLIEKS